MRGMLRQHAALMDSTCNRAAAQARPLPAGQHPAQHGAALGGACKPVGPLPRHKAALSAHLLPAEGRQPLARRIRALAVEPVAVDHSAAGGGQVNKPHASASGVRQAQAQQRGRQQLGAAALSSHGPWTAHQAGLATARLALPAAGRHTHPCSGRRKARGFGLPGCTGAAWRRGGTSGTDGMGKGRHHAHAQCPPQRPNNANAGRVGVAAWVLRRRRPALAVPGAGRCSRRPQAAARSTQQRCTASPAAAE